jgi:hypothetical protein
MSEVIVGINKAGIVRAVFAIDTKKNEKEAERLAGKWLKSGRTVKRCDEKHAFPLLDKPWVEPVST